MNLRRHSSPLVWFTIFMSPDWNEEKEGVGGGGGGGWKERGREGSGEREEGRRRDRRNEEGSKHGRKTLTTVYDPV